MKSFIQHQGIVIPINRANIDTDAIIPKQYLKSIKRTGFGVNLFDDWRYLDPGDVGMDHSLRHANPNFILNDPRYKGGSILLAQRNFGCGSSREHAVWALDDFGIRAIIAPSFADIFYNNCFKSGLLPIVLPQNIVDDLFESLAAHPGYRVVIDLPTQTVKFPDGNSHRFDIDGFRKNCLLNGLDDIGLTLQHADEIRSFEKKQKGLQPWLW